MTIINCENCNTNIDKKSYAKHKRSKKCLAFNNNNNICQIITPKFYCESCKEDVTISNRGRHIKSKKHIKNTEIIIDLSDNIITEEEEEFRQIQQKLKNDLELAKEIFEKNLKEIQDKQEEQTQKQLPQEQEKEKEIIKKHQREIKRKQRQKKREETGEGHKRFVRTCQKCINGICSNTKTEL